MSDLLFRNLGVAYGAGYYEGKGLYYFGAMGEAAWDGYALGGAILAGTVYPNSEVLRFAGIFWVAMGVGVDCDPGTWDSWDTRWWGDSWCYTVGAAFGLNYINPTADSSKWDYDYDFDYE